MQCNDVGKAYSEGIDVGWYTTKVVTRQSTQLIITHMCQESPMFRQVNINVTQIQRYESMQALAILVSAQNSEQSS